jgi:hypothetical protein
MLVDLYPESDRHSCFESSYTKRRGLVATRMKQSAQAFDHPRVCVRVECVFLSLIYPIY